MPSAISGLPHTHTELVSALRREARKAAAASQAAAQRTEIEQALEVPAGITDSLQLVLEAVQRVIQLEGNPGDHLLRITADCRL